MDPGRRVGRRAADDEDLGREHPDQRAKRCEHRAAIITEEDSIGLRGSSISSPWGVTPQPGERPLHDPTPLHDPERLALLLLRLRDDQTRRMLRPEIRQADGRSGRDAP